MKKPPFRWLALGSLALALFAVTASRSQTDAVPPLAPALEQEALQTATYAQRSDFTIAVRSVAAKIDALIVPLTKRQKGGIAGGADAITLENLLTSRTQLGHEIGKLEEVTSGDWVSLRDAVLAALVQTQDAYEKAAREYNTRP